MRRAVWLLVLLGGLAFVVSLCGCGGDGQVARGGVDTAGKPPPPPPGGLTNPAFAFAQASKSSRCRIYVMTFDGSKKLALTTPPTKGGDGWPTWSPDASKIIFARAPVNSLIWLDLYTVKPDGSGLTQIYSFPSSCDRNLLPKGKVRWFPDGNSVLYESDRSRAVVLDTTTKAFRLLDDDLNLGGYDPATQTYAWTRLTNVVPGPDTNPELDGYQGLIAYLSWETATGELHICVVRVKTDPGTGRLVRDDNLLGGPTASKYMAYFVDWLSWSPDGSTLSFTSMQTDLLTMPVTISGDQIISEATTIFTGQGLTLTTWSPNGQRIAFSPSSADLMWVSSIGGPATNLTNSPNEWELDPDWNPKWVP